MSTKSFAWDILAMLPNITDGIAAQMSGESPSVYKRRVLQECMRRITAELAPLCADVVYMKCPDGQFRPVRFFLDFNIMDGMEHMLHTGCHIDSCIQCDCPARELDNTMRYVLL
jgi:hypothetical protein